MGCRGGGVDSGLDGGVMVTRFLFTHPIEATLLAFYVALAAKSVAIRDCPRAMYWCGSLILMTGVLMGMGKR